MLQRVERSVRDKGPLAFVGWGAVALAVVGIAAFFLLPGVLLTGYHFNPVLDRVKAIEAVRTSVLQLLGGVVVIAGAYLTAATLRLNRAGHISDRFSKAVDQIGASEAATRVGGVYALERVMRDAPSEQRAVLETLIAFLREQRSLPKTGPVVAEVDSPSIPPADAAAALRVVGRRDAGNDPEGRDRFGWNLTELDLRDFSLRLGDFAGVNFWRADLRRANLIGADLTEARNLGAALLAGAVYDPETSLFPSGFEPSAHEMHAPTQP